jgi:ubiquinone biosynthesis protein
MQLAVLARTERNARRLGEILAILGKYGLADWLSGLDYDWLHGLLVSYDGERLGKLTKEGRVRLALTDLGPTFIKLGQVLSTREDILGPALARELTKLCSQTPPDPPETVREIIQADLGKPVEELFASFEDVPLASASIGQVHPARLANGDAVVVKVQHAGIEDKIKQDLDIMGGLAELAQTHLTALRPYQPTAMVREFRRIILQELDFTSERRNQEEFIRHFARDRTVHFPAVHPALCSRRVLTMERLRGVSAEDVEGLRKSGVDLNEFARRGANMYLEMIFRHGFYHADPHPGNLMLLPGGVVGVMDCGMVGRIDDQLREEIEDILLSILQGDTQELTAIFMRLGAAPVDLDRDALRSEVSAFLAEYGSQSVHDLDLSEALNRMRDIIHRYRIVLPPSCSLLIKTLVMLDGTSRSMRPSFSVAELIQPYATKALRRRFSPGRLAGKLVRAARDWDRLLSALPRELTEILHRVRSGTMGIRHEHRRLENTVNRLILGLVASALFVGSAFLWGNAAPPAVFGVSIPGVLGYVAAVVMGYRLLRAIRQAGADQER